jgi:hypothetical protein
MTKKEALQLMAGNQPLSDLLLKQVREAITNGVSSAETDAEVKAQYGTATVAPVVKTEVVEDEDEYWESSDYESSEC